MPRVKQRKPKHIPSEATSTDPAAAATEAPAFAPGVADAAEPVPAEGAAKPKKPRVVKPKPCQRCEDRRARERQYAKSSRLRLRLAATSAPPASPEGGAGVADATAAAQPVA